MACFHPLEAWQRECGRISFTEVADARRALWLPCGRCIGCRHVRARSWAIRCMHEASMHSVNAFVTLTYDDAHCPVGLQPGDFKKFMYRLRAKLGRLRFYGVGEYGESSFRPHYHLLLFGHTFGDGVPCGESICCSGVLSKLWPLGFSSFGDVTYESAGYVARYCLKKVTGEIASIWYTRLDDSTGELVRVEPEFCRMSLKNGGIGYSWFRKYWKDVYAARDGVVLAGGHVVPPPRYYDKLLYATDPNCATRVEFDRYLRSQAFVDDCTPQRLAVRERCAKARESFRRRGL